MNPSTIVPKLWTYRSVLRDEAMGERLLFPKTTVLE
jgi:hypothetical protein